jgi:hypothetical protein
MNLSELKQQLGHESLNFNTVVTSEGVKTSWMKQWDNTNRIAILIHKDTLAKIKATPGLASLDFKTATKQGAQGEYTAKTIVAYAEAEETL